eukprot:3586657-Rhodomonas_salina.4
MAVAVTSFTVLFPVVAQPGATEPRDVSTQAESAGSNQGCVCCDMGCKEYAQAGRDRGRACTVSASHLRLECFSTYPNFEASDSDSRNVAVAVSMRQDENGVSTRSRWLVCYR